MKKQVLQVLPTVVLVIICLLIATELVFVRFVHYKAQRRILDPTHYTANVIPVSAGKQGRADSSEFLRTEDGQYYVRVATLGTAHHLERTTSDLLPPFVLALAGVIAALVAQRRQKAEPNQQV